MSSILIAVFHSEDVSCSHGTENITVSNHMCNFLHKLCTYPKSAYPGMFNSNDPPALKSIHGLQPSPLHGPPIMNGSHLIDSQALGNPPSPRPTTPPPSPLDAAMQAVQNRIDLADQQEAHLQQLLQRQLELARKQQRVATIQHELQAVSQPGRSCQHCHHPLFIHLADDTLEPYPQ